MGIVVGADRRDTPIASHQRYLRGAPKPLPTSPKREEKCMRAYYDFHNSFCVVKRGRSTS
jgi:hypothetical protein